LYHFQEIKCCTGEGKPQPRNGHKIVQYKGRVYSFGDCNPDFELVDELWELNLTTGKWTKCEKKGDKPEQRDYHTAVCHPLDPGVMLMYGGLTNTGPTDTVVSCHLETREFKKVVIEEGEGQPMALFGQAAVTDKKGLFYTVGGRNFTQCFMDVNMLDLRSSPPVWSSLYRLSGAMDEPKPRWSHELCLWERRLFVLGGRTFSSTYGFDDLPTFDIEERRWFYTRTKADQHASLDNSEDGYPAPRECQSIVQIGKHVWIFGGCNGGHVFGDAWQLDISTMQWTRSKMEMPFPVHSHAMTVSDEGKMVMYGGNDDMYQRTDRVFTAWLTVPSLRSMAWEAVCHYQPSIATLPHTTLLEEGVPKDCVKMLCSDTTSQAV